MSFGPSINPERSVTRMSLLIAERLSSDNEDLNRAAELLRGGSLVVFPTETVYGLGVDATNERAVAKVFEAKGRPAFNPLILHVASVKDISDFAVVGDREKELATKFWPGPLTMVLQLMPDNGISRLATSGLETVAVRVPAHPVARALLQKVSVPIAAPSANPSGFLSPTDAEHVFHSLGDRVAAIVDAGPCTVGLESTILDVRGDAPTLLRPGGITREAVEGVVGALREPDGSNGTNPSSPGQLMSHYAPNVAIRLNALAANEDEQLLGFGSTVAADLNLSVSENLVEAAANLFRHLHELDARGRPIAVVPIPDVGLGRAINDRLRRAAAG